MKLLVIDAETGGLDPSKHSLLSWAGAVWNNGEIVDTVDFYVSERHMKVEPRAMEINKLDLSEVDFFGQSPSYAARTLDKFLDTHFGMVVPERTNKIVLAGQNVNFDIGFTKRLYRLARRPRFYEQRFSHRTLDTAGIMRYLYLAGKIPFDNASLDKGLAYFGIEISKEDRHTALGDAIATAHLLTHLVRL